MSPPNESLRHISRRKFFEYCLEAAGALLTPVELLEWRAYPILKVNTDKPYVAITVDDGYDPEQVKRFLRIGQIFKTNFTVFPVGAVLLEEPDLWRQVYDDGHEIGNHSHSHLDVSQYSKKAILRDFSRFENEDYPEAIGLPFPERGLARVPLAQGPVNTDVQEVIAQLNDLHVHWRIDSYSWKKGGKYSRANLEYVMERMQAIKQGDIIILHFTRLDMNALPSILRLLHKKGLVNVTFSELWQSRKQSK